MSLTPRPWKYGVRRDGSMWLSLGNPVAGPHRQGDLVATKEDADLIIAAPELLDVVKSFVAETIDYATINKLGDPEQQHNVKWARAVLAKAEGGDA